MDNQLMRGWAAAAAAGKSIGAAIGQLSPLGTPHGQHHATPFTPEPEADAGTSPEQQEGGLYAERPPVQEMERGDGTSAETSPPPSQPLYVHKPRYGSTAVSPTTLSARNSAGPAYPDYGGAFPEVASTLDERTLHSAPTLSISTNGDHAEVPQEARAEAEAPAAPKPEAPRAPSIQIELRPKLHVRVPAAAVDELALDHQKSAQLETSLFQLHLPVRIVVPFWQLWGVL